jgi:aminoglycoside phosphotransferase
VRIVESGRFVHPAGADAPARFLETHLLSLHGRLARLRAIAGVARANRTECEAAMPDVVQAARALEAARGAEWLLLRDYDESGRERSVIFFFRGPAPHAVVKVRPREGAGSSLAAEADALRTIAPRLDAAMRRTLPRVVDLVVNETREILVLAALPGRSLSILMQRSMRPRLAHARHLASAGRWLGRFHRMTGGAVHGDFWPRNVLFAADDVAGVVDWEHARVEGSPWSDLFLLPMEFATRAPSWRPRDARREIAHAFFERGPLARAIDAYLRAYAAETGVARASIDEELRAWLPAHGPK